MLNTDYYFAYRPKSLVFKRFSLSRKGLQQPITYLCHFYLLTFSENLSIREASFKIE